MQKNNYKIYLFICLLIYLVIYFSDLAPEFRFTTRGQYHHPHKDEFTCAESSWAYITSTHKQKA